MKREIFNIFLVSWLIIYIGACTNDRSEIVKTYRDGARQVVCPIDKDSLAHGIVKHFYKSGKIEIEQEYYHGLKNGFYKSYYENGSLRNMSNFIKDDKEGVSKSFFRSGSLKSEKSYKSGLGEGMYKFLNEKGIITLVGYNENDTSKFFAEYNEKGDLIDYFSERAILPKDTIINTSDFLEIKFKVYGDVNKVSDINYCLVNLDSEDTLNSGTIIDYPFNTDTTLMFKDLSNGVNFIDFEVPMLDTMFMITSFIRVENK